VEKASAGTAKVVKERIDVAERLVYASAAGWREKVTCPSILAWESCCLLGKLAL